MFHRSLLGRLPVNRCSWLTPLALTCLCGALVPEAWAHDDHGAAALGVEVRELANSSKEWDGRILPPYPSGQPQVKVLRITIPAGVRLPLHWHPVINAAVILKGALSLELADGSRRTFGEGEALVEVVNTIHTGQALGDDPVELVVFYAGVQGSPTTVLTTTAQPPR